MTVSMRVMSVGDGYRCLLKGVATGDRDRRDPNPLVGYFTEDGNPPGRWLGSGLHAFGDGQIKRGDIVTAHQLQLLLGSGHDPVIGEPLGRAFSAYDRLKARIAARVADLPSDLTPEQREEAAAAIAEVLGLMEREVAVTAPRRSTDRPDAAVVDDVRARVDRPR